MTESEIIHNMNNQEGYYRSHEQESLNKDTLKTIQGYLKIIYRQAKFLSDTGNEYNEPKFVTSNGYRSQSVQICEYLWKKLGMTICVN